MELPVQRFSWLLLTTPASREVLQAIADMGNAQHQPHEKREERDRIAARNAQDAQESAHGGALNVCLSYVRPLLDLNACAWGMRRWR